MKKNLIPSKEECKKYLSAYEKLSKYDDSEYKHYKIQENIIENIFKSCPENTDIEEILLKVSLLNDFYSTNIFGTYAVARHICELKIDERLEKGDLSLIHEIAKNVLGGKSKFFYSFATKYCAKHQPEKFPIFDSKVCKVLCYCKKQKPFTDVKFKNKDLKDYSIYCKVYEDFRNHFGLKEFTLAEIDKYLWMFGKEYF